ncbi:hypothetical protein ACHHYP_05374 [Achlya hypogyna]|uniref:FHA domain-containing protein n=1 Tax=Achlya hypogyna TaxID=1202772 RepID=A0A1V9YY99_ACHHY|nr:hypothetical protein ACHHYP_05374 [Achlya hypogyna]
MALESKPTMDDVAATPAGGLSGATISTYATTFQPPEWAVAPTEKSTAVHFEVMRMNKSCGTHELGSRDITVFGREQNGCDFVLANPSVSRKHATVIHCAKGGVYIVDLMSRHGTFVGKVKIPPHDPYLLHEGDVVTFGQSCRTYVLKGVDPTGLSAPVKKPWRLLKLPKFGSTGPSPPKKPARKYNDVCIKMVNKICAGTFSAERAEEFANEVSELDDELVDDVAALLVEKVKGNYASAHLVILALLEAHVGLKEFENNLSGIVQVSQTNMDARKILQTIAEARVESSSRMDTPNPSDDERDDDYDDYAPPDVSYAPPAVPYAPPVASYAPPATTYAPPTTSYAPPATQPPTVEVPATYAAPPSPTPPLPDSRHYSDSEEEKEDYDDYDDGDYDREYEQGETEEQHRQRVLSDEGKRLFAQATHSPVAAASGFSFITPSSPSPVAASAFGFIAASGADEPSDEEETEAFKDVEIPEGFLSEQPTMDPQDFSNLWQGATVSEEWVEDLSPEYDMSLLERCLLTLNVTLLANGVVGGMHKFYYYAEQASNGTLFMVEVIVNESLGELSATFKWIELGLLYDDGHLLFIRLFQECLEPCYIPNHPRTPYLRSLVLEAPAPSPAVSAEAEVDLGEELLIEDTASFEASLSTAPELDPTTFEALYLGATDLDTIEDTVDRDLPEAPEIIAQFYGRRLFCIAHGALETGDKFFFYARMAQSKCLFFLELLIERETTNVTAICKYAPVPSAPIQEDIAIWFIGLVEEVLVELE